MIEFYTKAEVENVLTRLSLLVHGRMPVQYNQLVSDIKRSGFSFVKVSAMDIQGSYFGSKFKLLAQENIRTGQLDQRVLWE